ncbi:putative dehydrogenase [Paenibacillus castaneae]|uniref:Gfo/Idh/MocA family protein n=1 Tax=Paenibacillus castaneae TaxID=474957 RepID=UPI000C9B8198|nr:Gfo/Idh/MocA family oxidoreductase [Paenibacillus castaneae]NIK76856.1 putative dehydrogenase [Paenibacillus castaneae]
MKNQTISILGAGAIARHHAEALKNWPASDNIQLAVTDVNIQTLEDFGNNYPEAILFRTIDELLSMPTGELDIIIVATPPFAHFELVQRALISGRHVLCEKPLAMNRVEAEKMLTLAKNHNRLLACCSNRFLGVETTEEVKRLIERRELGELYHMTFIQKHQRSRTGIEYQPSSRWFLDSSKSGGGTLMDWGPYDMACLIDLLSPVRVDIVSAWLSNPETESTLGKDFINDVEQHVGASLIFYGDGTLYNKIHVTYERAACTHGLETSIVQLEGSCGAANWDWLCWDGKGNVNLTTAVNDGVNPLSRTFINQDGLAVMERPLHGFMKALRGEKSRALLNEQAVFNFSILQAIYESAATMKPQSLFKGESR